MRAQSPIKNVIAVIQQMLRRDGGCNRPCGLAHIVHPLLGGQMLKHHLELGKASTQRNHHPLNKSGLTVKDINLRISDRSEEHTSELQSRGHLVCRLLLEKKKNNNINLQ